MPDPHHRHYHDIIHTGTLRPLLPSPPPPKPETTVLSLLLKAIIMTIITSLFLVFLGLATALLCVHFCIASRALRGPRYHINNQTPSSSTTSQFPNPSSGFSPHDLKHLSQFRFSKRVKPYSQTDCVICLDGFRDGQWGRKLSACGHVFHRKCVDSWLVKVSACPICRTQVCLDTVGSGSRPGFEEEEGKEEFWAFGSSSDWRVW